MTKINDFGVSTRSVHFVSEHRKRENNNLQPCHIKRKMAVLGIP